MDNNELIWGSRVVFFGEADHGKSSLMGFMFAESQKTNMDRHEEELQEELGSHYKLDYLYSSLINPLVADVADSGERYRTRKYHMRDFLIGDADPIVITLIDTPGQLGGRYRRARSNQEYGISKGRIGVFCLSILHILDEGFDGAVFNRTKLWRAFHKNQKIIVALTQFDRVSYSKEVYDQAVKKIYKYLPESEILEVIPVAINFKKRSGVNVFKTSENTPWYSGLTLLEAITQQYFEIANNTFDGMHPSDLVFSIDREFPHPRSNAGKVWRVFVENGVIQVGTEISLSSVKREGDGGSGTPLVATATIKEFKIDIRIDEDADDADVAYKGTSMSLNLKNCYIEGEKCHKREIETTDQTIGLARDIEFEMHRDLFIKFDNEEDVLRLRSYKQLIQVLVFGRGTSAMVTGVAEDLSGIFIQTSGNKYITLPKRTDLRALGIFRDVVVGFPITNDEFEYLPAKLYASQDEYEG